MDEKSIATMVQSTCSTMLCFDDEAKPCNVWTSGEDGSISGSCSAPSSVVDRSTTDQPKRRRRARAKPMRNLGAGKRLRGCAMALRTHTRQHAAKTYGADDSQRWAMGWGREAGAS